MPYRTLDNRIDGVVITFVDVTECKDAADAVIRRLAAVVENSVDAIFSKDLDGTIRTWNGGAERLYGYSHDEAVGRSVEMLVPEDRAEEWTNLMATLTRGEHVDQLETERIRKDGQRRAVALTVSPIRDRDGKVVSASVIGRDVTRRKQLEREVVEIASLEQRRIGQDLHDSVGQELTALNMLAGNLAETLRTDPSNVPKLVERWSRDCSAASRSFGPSSAGCFPWRSIPRGSWPHSPTWPTASSRRKTDCIFDCPKPVPVDGQPHRDAPLSHRPGSGPQRRQARPVPGTSAFPWSRTALWSCACKTTASACPPNRPRTTAGWVFASCRTARAIIGAS